MASNFAMIKLNIWRIKFSNLSKDARLLAIFLMTNEFIHMVGIYHIPIFNMSLGTGLDETKVREVLKELAENDFCEYHEESMYIWVKDMARTQVSSLRNEKQLKGVRAQIVKLHIEEECIFVQPFLKRYNDMFDLPGDNNELDYSSIAHP